MLCKEHCTVKLLYSLKRRRADNISAQSSCAWVVSKYPWWEFGLGSLSDIPWAFQPYSSAKGSVLSPSRSWCMTNPWPMLQIFSSLLNVLIKTNLAGMFSAAWNSLPVSSFSLCVQLFLVWCLVRLIVVWGLLQVHVVLKLWKSGFSLDSGELRSYQDPSNAQFLDDIRRGYVARGQWKKSCILKHSCSWNPGCLINGAFVLSFLTRARFLMCKRREGRLEDLLQMNWEVALVYMGPWGFEVNKHFHVWAENFWYVVSFLVRVREK